MPEEDDDTDICGAPTTRRDGRPCQRDAGLGRPSDSGPCWEHAEGSRLHRSADMARYIARCLAEKLPGTSVGRLARQAGAPAESDTERSGAFSYHAETHAAAMGLFAGFWYGATGEQKLMAVIAGIALYASRGGTKLDPKIAQDIRQEPHYALFFIIPGYVLGFFSANGYLPDQIPVPFMDWVIRWLVVNGWLLVG